MATNRFASSVVSAGAIETLPQYPWRIADPAAPLDSNHDLEIEAEWKRAYDGLHASDANPIPIGSRAWTLATNKLHQLRAVWPLLQLSEIRSMKGRPPL